MFMLVRRDWTGRECVAWFREYWNTCVRCITQMFRDGMKPRYRILRRSLGSVFMLPAIWCDSEVRALATEAVLMKLESPLCNVVDGFGSTVEERRKVKGKRKRPSSWLRRSKPPFTSIWSHQSVLRPLYTSVRSVV